MKLLLLTAMLMLMSCATTGGEADIPQDAVPSSRTEANGDVITEYRVGTQLRVVKLVPARGPTYYAYDRDGDGLADKAGDKPPMTDSDLLNW